MTLCSLIFIVAASYGAQDIPALRDAKDPGERARVQTLIEAARAEGKLEWIGGFIEPPMAKFLIPKFKEYYGLPNLNVEYTYGGTTETVTRVEQLLSAGKKTFDINWNAQWAWYNSLLARGRILRYDSPRYKEYTISNNNKLSRAGYWVSDGIVYMPMYNPKAVVEAGLKDFNPTSWWDFTAPKLKGKVSMGNISQSVSYAQIALGLRKVLGIEWYKKLAKDIKPALFIRTVQGRDWVVSGEFPITLTSYSKAGQILRQQGVDVKLVFPKEGNVMIPLSPIIFSDGAHPNAAKLFIDYIRSPVGTNAIVDSGGLLFFGRPGVKNLTPDLTPPVEEINLIPMDWDVDCTEKAFREIQKMCIDVGLC